jgi:hypothetical protein
MWRQSLGVLCTMSDECRPRSAVSAKQRALTRLGRSSFQANCLPRHRRFAVYKLSCRFAASVFVIAICFLHNPSAMANNKTTVYDFSAALAPALPSGDGEDSGSAADVAKIRRDLKILMSAEVQNVKPLVINWVVTGGQHALASWSAAPFLGFATLAKRDGSWLDRPVGTRPRRLLDQHDRSTTRPWSLL